MPERVRLMIDRIATPTGELMVVADEQGRLRAIQWADREDRMTPQLRRFYGSDLRLTPARDPGGLSRALRAYFDGAVDALDPLPVETAGTPFQKAVWRALRNIPRGATTTYGDLAARLGRPAAVRAVGAANGANPVSIVVPCHRVIGADGTLTGYGGGLDRKRWLLRHEGVGIA